MECNYAECNNEIPETRRSDAKYCSNRCYKIAKRVRDSIDYMKRTQLYDIIKENNFILCLFFQLQHEIPKEDLDNLGFNFNTYVGTDYIDDEKLFVMYDYAYSLRNTSNGVMIKIWKKGK